MAQIQNPIIGRAKKTAGGMVFYTLYGKNTMRSKAFAYRDKNSTLQQSARALFAAAVSLASLLKFYAVSLFETPPVGMSAYSKILSQVRSCFEFVGTVLTYKPANKIIGSGSLGIASEVVMAHLNPYVVDIQFSDVKTSPDEDDTDIVKFLVTSLDGKKVAVVTTSDTRSEGHSEITVPTDFGPVPSKVFISYPIFVSADGTKQSAVLLSDNNVGVDI